MTFNGSILRTYRAQVTERRARFVYKILWIFTVVYAYFRPHFAFFICISLLFEILLDRRSEKKRPARGTTPLSQKGRSVASH